MIFDIITYGVGNLISKYAFYIFRIFKHLLVRGENIYCLSYLSGGQW